MKELNENLHEAENVNIPVEALFYPEKATLLLHIDSKIPNLESKREEADRLGLSKKDEFHFTIIGSDTGDEILKSLEGFDEKEKEERLNKIRKLNESMKWSVILKNDFFYVQKDYPNPDSETAEKRESIIQMAEIEKIDEFYQKLNLLFGKQFETPLPHITLYTTSTREDKKLRGIGIYSKNQFEELNPKKI